MNLWRDWVRAYLYRRFSFFFNSYSSWSAYVVMSQISREMPGGEKGVASIFRNKQKEDLMWWKYTVIYHLWKKPASRFRILKKGRQISEESLNSNRWSWTGGSCTCSISSSAASCSQWCRDTSRLILDIYHKSWKLPSHFIKKLQLRSLWLKDQSNLCFSFTHNIC